MEIASQHHEGILAKSAAGKRARDHGLVITMRYHFSQKNVLAAEQAEEFDMIQEGDDSNLHASTSQA